MGQAFLPKGLHNKTLKGVTDQSISHVDLLMFIHFRWLGTSMKDIQTVIFPNDKVMTSFLHLITTSAVVRNGLPKIIRE